MFLRLGFTAFGGPAAHVALMERELVDRRGWLTRDELVELYGAASLLPGPNSTELAIHIGYRRGYPRRQARSPASGLLPTFERCSPAGSRRNSRADVEGGSSRGLPRCRG